jgi:quinohemoprotein ethanol dehydrogenase
VLAAPEFKVDAAKAEQGKLLYKDCVICHGVAAVAGGYAPDLRASAVPLSADAFKAIVQGGALEGRGMPPFAEFSDDELGALQHYIRQRAEYTPSVWDQVKTVWGFLVLLLKMQLAKLGWI